MAGDVTHVVGPQCNDFQCQYSIYTRIVDPFLNEGEGYIDPTASGKLITRNKKLLKFVTTVQAIFMSSEKEIVIPLLGSATVQIEHEMREGEGEIETRFGFNCQG